MGSLGKGPRPGDQGAMGRRRASRTLRRSVEGAPSAERRIAPDQRPGAAGGEG